MLGRRSFILFLSKMLTAALAYVGLKLIATYMDTDAYGTISAALALVATFNAVSDLGFGSAHVKRISEGCDPDKCISTYAFIKIVLTAAMVVLILSSMFIYREVMGKEITDTGTDIIMLFILYQVLYDLSSIATTTFQARLEMAKMPLVTLADPLIRVPLVAFVALNRMGVMELSVAYMFGAVAVFATSVYLIFREKVRWTRPVLFRSYLTFALPLMVITLVSAGSANADRLLITFFWNPDDVGLYAAPAVFLGVFATISTAVSTLTFPSFSKLHEEGNLRQIRALSTEAERYIAMIGLPITILLIMFPYEVCSILLDEKYYDSGKALGIMAVTTFITMINAVHSSQIVAVGRPDISARITIITVVINVSLMLCLIPGFGLGLSFVGAALALLFGNIISFVLVRYSVHRLTGTGTNPRLCLHLVAGAASALTLYLLSTVASISGWITLGVFTAASFGIFLAVLTALREFTRKDVDFFLSLVNVREMASYIREELRGEKKG